MQRIYHLEIHADEPERAIEFYSKVFGWAEQKKADDGVEDYWLFYTGKADEAGIHAGLKKRKIPGATMVPAIEVMSIDEFIPRITAAGGTVVVPKRLIPRTGYIAYCTDTEGNIFSIVEKGST